MKRLIYFSMAALLALVAISCKKEKKPGIPSVKTLEPTEIEANSACLNAWLDFADVNWGGLNYGFIWGTAEDTEGTYVEGKGIFTESGAYWAEITGLIPETEYWFKAYMEIDGQPYIGEILHFTTKLPLVTSAPGWLELPEVFKVDGFEFFCHDGTLNGKKIRNWSFYWDYDNRVSKWVAYPLYKSIFAGASRTDEWGYDPLLLPEKQQNVSGGYKEGNNGWYARGQQLPSADRAGFELNSTTFFSTNIVPQNSDFSGGLWMDLEGKVRSWAGQSDTCYVVSGCITKGAQYYVIDRSSEKVTVPTAFFKAVLRYSQATTIGTDGFCSIAFLFDHEEYSESGRSSLKVNKNMSISVKALEDALGYRLFVNLDNAIGEEKATAVKTENPQNNNWWWK